MSPNRKKSPMKYRSMFIATILGIVAMFITIPAQAGTLLGYSYSTPPNKQNHYCGSKTPQYCGLDNLMIRKINGTPCKGGRIDVILYSATNEREVTALLNKAKCGTGVRLITSHPKPDGENEGDPLDGQHKRLVTGLQKLHKPVKVCWGACARSGTAGIEHEKVVVFNRTEGTPYVVVSDSGNFTYQTDTAFNDRLSWSDRQSYFGVLSHIDRLWKDKDIKSEAPVYSKDRKHIIYWMPTSHTDPVVNGINRARYKKGCAIDVSYLYLTGSKSELVTDLVNLRKKGCRVRVTTNDHSWSLKQKRRLVSAGAEVYDVEFIWGKKHAKTYGHRKMTVATGLKNIPNTLWQGSTTMNDTAYKKNGNQVVQSRSASDISRARYGFGRMISYGHRVSKKEVGCVGKKQPSGC